MKRYHVLARAMGKGLVRSCHDCSEGGLGTALTESALGGRTGFDIALDRLPFKGDFIMAPAEVLFSESASRFVVSVSPRHERRFRFLMRGQALARLGTVTAGHALVIKRNGKRILSLDTGRALKAWKGRLS
jgi:phosphoribosylformylglycinamidine synthase